MRKLFGEGRMPLRAEVIGAALWELVVRPIGVWLLLGAGAVLGALARRVENLTDFEQGALYVASAVFLLLALAAGITLYRRHRGAPRSVAQPIASAAEERPSLPSAPPLPPPEPRAPAEALERLREVFAPWKQCFETAHNFLEADICRTSSNWTTEDPKQLKNGALSALLLRYVIRECHSGYADFNRKLMTAKELSISEFSELVGQFKAVINFSYDTLVRWLLAAGGPLVGVDRLRRAERYAFLYACHQEAIKELARVRSRSDLGHTAELVNELAKLLPEPIRRDPEDPFIEAPLELTQIAAWEGRSAVIGRKWFGVLAIREARQPGAYAASRITLYCIPTNSTAGHFSVHPVSGVSGKEEMLVPPREIIVEGTILELTEQTAVLFPAKIVDIIDLPSE